MRKVKDIIFRSLPQVLLLGFSMLTVGCGKEVNDFLGFTREVEATLPLLTVAEAVRVEPMGSRSVGTSAAEAGNDLFSVSVGLPQDASSADASGAQAAVSARSNAGAAAFPATRASVPLSNVWVFQFDTQGALATCAYVGTVAAGKRVTATLQSGSGYTVWIMANGPAASANLGEQITDIRDFELALHKWGDPTTDDQIALTGKLTDVRVLDNGQVLVGDDITVVPEIELTRAMARVDLLLEYDVSGAELDGVWLYNVPEGTCYGLDPSSTDFPSSATSSNFAYTDGEGEGLSPISAGSGTVTHTWYMGDNRRGENRAVSWEKNKGAVNAPAKATYARIVSHETADDSRLLYHDVYLGENLTTDFNVLRNRHYTYRVRIGGTLDEQKLLATKDDRVSTKRLEHIDKVWITPDPSLGISAEGGEYTFHVQGYWEDPVNVSIYVNNSGTVTGTVSYNASSNGGGTVLSVPRNMTSSERTITFKYTWKTNPITVTSGIQDLTIGSSNIYKNSWIATNAVTYLEVVALTPSESMAFCADQGYAYKETCERLGISLGYNRGIEASAEIDNYPAIKYCRDLEWDGSSDWHYLDITFECWNRRETLVNEIISDKDTHAIMEWGHNVGYSMDTPMDFDMSSAIGQYVMNGHQWYTGSGGFITGFKIRPFDRCHVLCVRRVDL